MSNLYRSSDEKVIAGVCAGIGYSISLANGNIFTRSIVRDDFRRSLIRDITSSINDLQVDTLSYGYDALNRPVSRNSDAFGYNERSEVTGAIVSNIAAEYGYDEIGNSTSFTANSLNQYSQFLYDSDGNLLSDGTYSFTYDSANRLKTVSTNGVLLVTNYYDTKSRRVKKVTLEATTTFFYDDWNLIEERIAYTDGTASTIHYYWGKDLSGSLQGAGGVGGLLYLTVDDAIYIPCYDNNGNITKYVDSIGNIVASYTYDAFGKLISKSGAFADLFRHRFSTKYFDIESGLYYYGYRFYHPTLMRWLNRDPIEEDGGLNLYGFCGNRPICNVDFIGLWSHPLWPDKPDVQVTQIPAIMRANKMSVSAKLMERWLSTANSSTMGEDVSTVKMNWALTFTRAKVAYDEIFTSQLYATERCKDAVRAKIRTIRPSKDIRFCDLSRDVRAIYKDQVTYKVVGSSYRDPIDDMLGALGRFTFQVAVSADVKVKPYGYCAIVDEVGVFIRDQYDFSGIQHLGYWNPNTNYVGKNPYKGSLVENKTFQIYRNSSGLGGDFYIYSDIKRTKLDKPIKLRITK